jgi:hypothetical protein
MEIWKKSKMKCEIDGNYGRKASRILIRYGQYRRKASGIEKRYEKYGRNPS